MGPIPAEGDGFLRAIKVQWRLIHQLNVLRFFGMLKTPSKYELTFVVMPNS
jgi:hypothetical protein